MSKSRLEEAELFVPEGTVINDDFCRAEPTTKLQRAALATEAVQERVLRAREILRKNFQGSALNVRRFYKDPFGRESDLSYAVHCCPACR